MGRTVDQWTCMGPHRSRTAYSVHLAEGGRICRRNHDRCGPWYEGPEGGPTVYQSRARPPSATRAGERDPLWSNQPAVGSDTGGEPNSGAKVSLFTGRLSQAV